MATAEQQQWSSSNHYNNGGTAAGTWNSANTRSEHAVSNPKPIMVQGVQGHPQGQQYQALMMSPRSVGEQTGIFHQMVENVLSSSPGSMNNRDLKFMPGMKPGDKGVKGMNGVDRMTIDPLSKKPQNEGVLGSPSMHSSHAVPIPIPSHYGNDGSMAALHLGNTPDLYPFMIPGAQGTPVVYTATSNAAAHFASTPTNYGYGSWSAVYPPPNGVQSQQCDNVLNSLGVRGIGTPPSSSLYSSSPTTGMPGSMGQYPVGYQPTQMIPNLASALSQMSISNQQQNNRRDSFNTSNPLGNGNMNNYPHPVPQPSQQYYVMTPPGASGFAGFARNMSGNHNPQMAPQNNQAGPPIYAPPQNQRPNMFNGMMQPMGHPPGPNMNGPRRPVSNMAFNANRMPLGPLDGEKNGQQRSQLLDDFRNSRIPHLQLSDLGKYVVEFAQDQHGSRFIQQKLERASLKEKQMVFDEVILHAHGLMTDVFGNYVIQKFFEHGTPEQRSQLGSAVKGNVLNLALQMYGCRVIQKALESIETSQQIEILKEMEGQVLKCVKDQNGNHVVQKVIERVEPSRLQFIIDAFCGNDGALDTVSTLSTHPYGCRVIQRVLEHCMEEQKRPVLEELISNVRELITDQYGNYVIQHVIEHGDQDDRDRIVEQIKGEVLKYAQHKFASNVIEKCLTCGNSSHKNALIEQAITGDGTNTPLLEMMKDPFANYVVQKMLDVADSTHRKKMMFAIKAHIPALRKYNYGKHIITKLEKYFQKNSTSANPFPQSIEFAPAVSEDLEYDHVSGDNNEEDGRQQQEPSPLY